MRKTSKIRLKFRAMAVSVLLFISILTGCGRQEASSSEESGLFGFESSSSSGEMVESYSLSFNLNCTSVNGKRVTYEEPLIYEGGALPFVLEASTIAESMDCDVNFLCAVNGALIPSRLNEEPQAQISHVLSFPKGSTKTITLTVDSLNLPMDRSSNLHLIAVANCNQKSPSNMMGFYPRILSSYSYLISPAQGNGSDQEIEQSVVRLEDYSDYQTNSRPDYYSEAEKKNATEDQEFSPYIKLYVEGKLDTDSAYVAVEQGDKLRLAVSRETGRYRTVVLVDNEPCPVFDGKEYLEWESTEGPGQCQDLLLDASAIEAGEHNVYALTLPLDEFKDGITLQNGVGNLVEVFTVSIA